MTKIFVVGVARNCSRSIYSTIMQVDSLFNRIAELAFFVVESDSNDDTVQELQRLSNIDSRFKYRSEGRMTEKIPNRIMRIAYCRNIYLEEFQLRLSLGVKFDYLLVVDLDGINNKIAFDGDISNLFDKRFVTTANQVGHYYDILALRASNWIEHDYRELIEKKYFSRLHGLTENVYRKQKKIRKNSTAIEVTSAFGGFALYPASSVVGCRYHPRYLGGDEYECEHVSFSKCATSNGVKIRILPALRNRGSIRHTFLSYNPFKLLLTLAIKFKVFQIIFLVRRGLSFRSS